MRNTSRGGDETGPTGRRGAKPDGSIIAAWTDLNDLANVPRWNDDPPAIQRVELAQVDRQSKIVVTWGETISQEQQLRTFEGYGGELCSSRRADGTFSDEDLKMDPFCWHRARRRSFRSPRIYADEERAGRSRERAGEGLSETPRSTRRYVSGVDR